MSTQRIPHSAQVDMVLHLAGQDFSVSQMGPDFIILGAALAQALPPVSGSLTLTVDDRREEIPMSFPEGIPSGQRRLMLGEPEDALVEV